MNWIPESDLSITVILILRGFVSGGLWDYETLVQVQPLEGGKHGFIQVKPDGREIAWNETM